MVELALEEHACPWSSCSCSQYSSGANACVGAAAGWIAFGAWRSSSQGKRGGACPPCEEGGQGGDCAGREAGGDLARETERSRPALRRFIPPDSPTEANPNLVVPRNGLVPRRCQTGGGVVALENVARQTGIGIGWSVYSGTRPSLILVSR